eukprot:3407389-Rhodomonas_salina.1
MSAEQRHEISEVEEDAPAMRRQSSRQLGSKRKPQRSFSGWVRPIVSLECETPNRAHTRASTRSTAASCFASFGKLFTGGAKGVQPSRVALDHQSDEDEEVEPIEIASNRSGGAAFGGWRFSREGSAARLRGSFAPSHGSTDSSAALPVCDLYHPMYCEDVLSIVFKKLDVVRTIQVRLVCKSWNSLLKRMCLDPIERVSKSDKTDRKQAYKTILLIRAFYEERALYGGQALLPASTRKESNSGIASTTELLLEMSARRELHNTNESAFLTSVQLADRFVSYKSPPPVVLCFGCAVSGPDSGAAARNASTHRYPAICAAALRIGCFTEQERELPPEVLAALAHTRCSTSDVLHEERSMREAFSGRLPPLAAPAICVQNLLGVRPIRAPSVSCCAFSPRSSRILARRAVLTAVYQSGKSRSCAEPPWISSLTSSAQQIWTGDWATMIGRWRGYEVRDPECEIKCNTPRGWYTAC